MEDKVRLKLVGISEIVGIDDVSLLALVDEALERQLVVTCEKNMRKDFLMYLEKKKEANLRAPKVLGRVLDDCGIHGLEVHILSAQDGVYETNIVETQHNKHFPIRCSDGVLFSVAARVPLYAPAWLMESHSVPFSPDGDRVGLPLTALSESMLRLALNKAIEAEDYELASNLRDELNKRHSNNEE